ncbi:MAG: hypothetical protein PHI66_03230 [Candidatus Pacebacteria bacterium]|nr:hypothetical protein [Candidatus Paceibacterota bacterium]
MDERRIEGEFEEYIKEAARKLNIIGEKRPLAQDKISKWIES